MFAYRETLLVEPMPTPRPRARAIPTRGRTIVSMYHPKEYTAYKAALAAMLKERFGDSVPFSTPVSVVIDIRVKKPKTSKLHAPKPDVDNYAKGVLDAMTDAGLWTDDALVVDLVVSKGWAEESAIEVGVEEA